MIPSGDLEERLASNIQTAIQGVNVYDVVRHPQAAVVREANVPGEARVALSLPEGGLAIQWTLPTGLFRVLQEEASADGAFIVRRMDGSFEAHIVECKRTVNRMKWREARKQMRWTLSRLRGLAGVLGIELQRGVLYTAFRTDDLSPDSARNPLAQRRPTGEQQWDQRAAREWVDDDVALTGFAGRFAHCKIQLDAQGMGSVPFDC